MFDRDERPRKNVTLENFQMLPPAFAEDGTITSGNASVPCDGAAAVIVAGEEAVKQGQWAPFSRLAGWVSIGVEPESVFSAAVLAIECCLSRSGLAIEEIDLFEISEAFAAQAIFTQRELRIPEEKMNICGSDLALGHPLGAAGARILVTLMHALRRHRKRYGVAAVCLGGGGAVAVAIENLKGSDA
jgi:acetyl-CoA C-acetyltransferase